MLEALSAGVIQLGSVGDTPPIFAQAANAKLVYAAATPSSPHGVLVQENSTIKSIADLKSKRVAFGKGSSAHNVTLQALRLAGLSLTDIVPVYLGPADASAAFVNDHIDAWTVWDPYYAMAEIKYKAHVLIDTKNEALKSHSFYIASSDFAQKYPQVLKAALEEIGKIDNWAKNHRNEIAKITAEATGVDLAALERTFDRSEFNFSFMTNEIIKAQQKLADDFYQLKIIPRSINISEVIWTPPEG